jgi:transcription elongation factor SPT6
MAALHVSNVTGFDSADKVLRGAMHMVAVELASEPAVRAAVRRLFSQHATLSTDPTPRGDEVLDPFHPYGVVKRLRDKPLRKFESTEQYIMIRVRMSL